MRNLPEDFAGSGHHKFQPRNVAPTGATLVVVLHVIAVRAPRWLALVLEPAAADPTGAVAISPRIRRLGCNSTHATQ